MVEAITSKTIANVKTATAADSPATKFAAETKSTEEKAAAIATQPLNPRLRYDHRAGVVVTEFLSQSGDVQSQTPSNAVLAYLRVGLGVDGTPKDQGDKEGNVAPEKKPETLFDS